MTQLTPVHPGEVLRHDFMEPFALSVTALSSAIGVSPARISDIIHGPPGYFRRNGIASGQVLQDRRAELDESPGSL